MTEYPAIEEAAIILRALSRLKLPVVRYRDAAVDPKIDATKDADPKQKTEAI